MTQPDTVDSIQLIEQTNFSYSKKFVNSFDEQEKCDFLSYSCICVFFPSKFITFYTVSSEIQNLEDS